MSKVQFTLVGNDDSSNIIVFVEGGTPLVAADTHPNFNAIIAKAREGDESVVDLFDVAATVAQKFQRLSERVTTSGGRLYLDGEELRDTLTNHILRFMTEGVDDWQPLVSFLENMAANPNPESVEQLYDWLEANGDFTINEDGLIVGYKGVRVTDAGFSSISQGKATVNGAVFKGAIPNAVGDVIEMPRSEVEFNPARGCSVGLHVGTWNYASGFAQGAVLEVLVNPRDVCSVPTDSGAQKLRCCRYTVAGVIEQAYTSAFRNYGADEDYDGWGEVEVEDELDW